MKTITVKISDKTFAQMRTHLGVKYMTDEVCGLLDAFVSRLIRAIDNEESEVRIKMKGEKDDDILD